MNEHRPLLRCLFDLYELHVIALHVVYKENICIAFVCDEQLFVKNLVDAIFERPFLESESVVESKVLIKYITLTSCVFHYKNKLIPMYAGSIRKLQLLLQIEAHNILKFMVSSCSYECTLVLVVVYNFWLYEYFFLSPYHIAILLSLNKSET